MDTPTWQDTVTAWATLGAVVVALALGIVAEARNFRDRRDRRDEGNARREREEAAQAQRVSAWLEDRPAQLTPGQRYAGGSLRRVLAVALNASIEPVWDVVVLVDNLLEGDVERTDLWTMHAERIGMIPPGERVERELRSTPPDADSPAPLSMTFRDSAGVWWQRNGQGELIRRTSPPGPSDNSSPAPLVD